MDPSRQMSDAAREASNLIVNPAVYANPPLLDATFKRLRNEDPLAWCEPDLFRPFWAVPSEPAHTN